MGGPSTHLTRAGCERHRSSFPKGKKKKRKRSLQVVAAFAKSMIIITTTTPFVSFLLFT